MESTEKQVKTTASDSLIFKCDICGTDCCSRCEGKNQYWNGFLCNSCYNSFHIRSTTRIKKIKKKREIRNQYPSFSFEIKRSSCLKTSLDALTSIDLKGTLIINDKDLNFICLDPSRIYYSELKLPDEELENIAIPNIEQRIFLDLGEFKASLDSFSESTKFLFHRMQGDKNLYINPINTRKSITIFPLKTDEDLEDTLKMYTLSKIHKIDFRTFFFIEKETLIDILENCQSFSEYFTLTCTKESVTFKAEGVTTNYNYEFLSNELEIYTWEKDSKNQYQVKPFLIFIEKLAEITETIKISQNTGDPLKVDINNNQALFYIASRVSGNEEEED